MNRSDFRKGGLQGRRDSTETDGKWQGLRRGSFLGRTPSIPYAPRALAKAAQRALRAIQGKPVRRVGRTRIKRKNARARAAW